MALIRSSEPSELPKSQIEYQEQQHGGTAKHWLTLIAYIILAFIIAVLVVLAARGIYHKVHHVKNTNTSSTSQSSTQGATSQPNSNSNKTGTSSSNANSGGTNKSGSSGSSGSSSSTTQSQSGSSAGSGSHPSGGTSTTQTPSTLPNNGPGDIIAIFAGTSIVASGLHFIVAQKRRKKINSFR